MNYKPLVKALLSVCSAVYHNEANQEKGNYIVWHEIGVRAMNADNCRAEKADRIAVDLFTRDECSDLPDRLECALNCADLAFRGPDVIYNQVMKITQYAYTVEVI